MHSAVKQNGNWNVVECVQVLVCEYVQDRETEREREAENSMCIPAASQVLGRVQGRLSAGTVLSRLFQLSRRPI